MTDRQSKRSLCCQQAYATGVEDERKRCIEIAEDGMEYDGTGLPAIQSLEYSHQWTRNKTREKIAAAIRNVS